MIHLLVAFTPSRVIGKEGKLPWNLSEDLQLFKQKTMGSTVIMGRKTYESIGRALPGRHNIVVSSTITPVPGIRVCPTLDSAISLARTLTPDCYIIGGARLYEEALKRAEYLNISHLKEEYEGDTYFPNIDLSQWEVVEEKIYNDFTHKTYKRNTMNLSDKDPEVFTLTQQEKERQDTMINLIPSENFVSQAVREACGSELMHKYSEGYPRKRYYQGNDVVDDVEELAIERAKQLFGAEHANVQPYSGSPANLAILNAFLEKGDTFLGLDLKCGGHLTHGSPVNVSGKWFNAVSYSVDQQSKRIDMHAVRALAREHKPKLIISGLTAYPRTINFRAFQDIAEEVGAIHLADISHIAGLIVAGVHPSPFPFTDVVMSTTHKTLRGPRGALILCKEKYAQQIDKGVFPGMQGGPHNNVIAGKAVAFKEALSPAFKEYGKQVVLNATVLAETLMQEGISLVTEGTDNHLILIDLTPFGVGLGRSVAVALEAAGIITNCNTIPFDPSTPFKPSGLRIGTPMCTSRGMKEAEMKQLGRWMGAVIKEPENEALHARIREEVKVMCKQFPTTF